MRTGTLGLSAVAVLAWTFSAWGAGVNSREPSEVPPDILKGIDAMARLPAEGFHVVEVRGQLLLMSTNGHYVVTGGRLLDLWNQKEVRAVKDVEASSRIPLARMGLTATTLGGVTVGQGEAGQTITVFLDPLGTETQKMLELLRGLGTTYRIDVVFVPAQPSRAGTSRALICDHSAARHFFVDGRPPGALPSSEPCGAAELDRARVTAELLGIHSLPFSIAPDGSTVAGTPSNYSAFIAAHRGAP